MHSLTTLYEYCPNTVKQLRETYDQAKRACLQTFFFDGMEWQTGLALAAVELLEARQRASKVTL